ncbi:hypothetical protein N7532_008986 [Penicillium argentinense]|uniref:Uncharacterized protein n=1 Tax=Penicillium argentinense TaxID=1131581 RepID=A0A9W9K319_9EURO|nr:uncharacterized protein N7532_008986 [Penicillium argentinense]KAJ5090302.1 hypothetical protein N7532_008986 [Penicillium argentinense]
MDQLATDARTLSQIGSTLDRLPGESRTNFISSLVDRRRPKRRGNAGKSKSFASQSSKISEFQIPRVGSGRAHGGGIDSSKSSSAHIPYIHSVSVNSLDIDH